LHKCTSTWAVSDGPDIVGVSANLTLLTLRPDSPGRSAMPRAGSAIESTQPIPLYRNNLGRHNSLPKSDNFCSAHYRAVAQTYWSDSFRVRHPNVGQRAQRYSKRMLIEFDQNTLANMTAALESVCKKLPADKDNHDNRKSIADAMIASARSGKRSYLDLKDAGAAALKQIMQPSKFGWLGLKQLFVFR
jgi:hypothetical protein